MDIVDPNDFCRECKGRGRYEDGEVCDLCRGTKRKTIRIGPPGALPDAPPDHEAARQARDWADSQIGLRIIVVDDHEDDYGEYYPSDET